MTELLSAFKDYEHLILGAFFVWAYFAWSKKSQSLMKEAADQAEKIEKGRHEAAKAEIKSALGNGITDMIKRLNAEQDDRWQATMARLFSEHEKREDATNRALLEQTSTEGKANCQRVMTSLEDHDRRLAHLEDHLDTQLEKLNKRRR